MAKPLEDISYEIKFTGGVDTSEEESLVLKTKVTSLTDAVFDAKGSPVQRGGHTVLRAVAADRLVTNGSELLYQLSGSSKRYTGLTSDTEFTNRNTLNDTVVDSTTVRMSKEEYVISSGIQPKGVYHSAKWGGAHDFALDNSGNECWAWEENDFSDNTATGRIVLHVQIINRDSSGRVTLLWDTTLGASTSWYTNPRVVYCPTVNKFWVFYSYITGSSSFALHRIGYDVAGQAEISDDEVTAIAYPHSVSVVEYPTSFDVDADEIGNLVFAVTDDTANKVYVRHLDPSDAQTSLHTYAGVSISASHSSVGVTIAAAGPSTYAYVYWVGQNTNPFDTVYSLCLNCDTYVSSGPSAVVTSTSGSELGRVSVVAGSSGASGAVYFVADETSAGTLTSDLDMSMGLNAVKVVSVTKGTAASGLTVIGTLTSDGALHARVLAASETVIYIPVALPDPSGTTVVLMRYDTANPTQRSNTIARVGNGEIANYTSYWKRDLRVPSMRQADPETKSNIYISFNRWVPDLQVVNGVISTTFTLNCALLDENGQLGQIEVNGLTLLGGACPHVYDGLTWGEAGPHTRPYIYALNPSGGTVQASDTFNFICIEQWTDAKGNIHYGPPSNIYTMTGPIQLVMYPETWAPFRTSRRIGSKLVFYRTLTGGAAGPYYRMFKESDGYDNDDAMSDADLLSAGSLGLPSDVAYTSGADGEELPNDPVPSFRQGCVWQGRVWLAGCDDGYNIYFSKEVVDGFGPEFSYQFKRRVPKAWGRVVAVQPLGERLAVICEHKVGQLFGNGPTATGEQDNYSQVQPLLEGVGGVWDSPRASVVTKDGVWFMTLLGPRLLGVGGQLVMGDGGEWGHELDPQFRAVPPSRTYRWICVQSERDRLVRFYSSNNLSVGSTWVFDERHQQWSAFSNQGYSDDVACPAGQYPVLCTGTALWQYTNASSNDNETPVVGSLTTAPIELAQIRGFQRIRRAQLLTGLRTSSTGMKLTYYVDGDSSSPYTAFNYTFMSAGYGVAFEHHMANQKCSAVAFTISWYDINAFVRLTGMKISAAVKGGLQKVTSSKRF